jgi:hypothetical protein
LLRIPQRLEYIIRIHSEMLAHTDRNRSPEIE